MSEKQWLDESGGRSVDQLLELANTHRIDSIVLAIEGALMAKPEVSSSEEVVLAVEAMEREVNNGGFEQFFSNSSNLFAPVLVSALERIGAVKTAEIAKRASRALGAAPEWTAEQFEGAALAANEPTRAELNACDEAYYVAGEDIADRLFDFIKRNRAEIEIGPSSA